MTYYHCAPVRLPIDDGHVVDVGSGRFLSREVIADQSEYTPSVALFYATRPVFAHETQQFLSNCG